MKTNVLKMMLAVALTTAFPVAMQAAATVGETAPDFTGTDIAGRARTLSAYQGKTVVLEWVNPGCPFVRKHYESGNLPRLQRAATADGVVWLAINSARDHGQGDLDDAAAAAWLTEKRAAPTAYLRDRDGRIARLYGAKATPQLFVINPEGKVVYNGAIDSIRSADAGDIARATNYVSVALEDLRAGRAIEKSSTQPYGCAVKY